MNPTESSNNFMQVLPGGLCFAHGPYTEPQCPQWPRCADDPQNPEYVAEGTRRVNEPKERARLEREVIEAAQQQRKMKLIHDGTRLGIAVDALTEFESKQK